MSDIEIAKIVSGLVTLTLGAIIVFYIVKLRRQLDHEGRNELDPELRREWELRAQKFRNGFGIIMAVIFIIAMMLLGSRR